MINRKKSFDNIQHPFKMRIMERLDPEETYLNKIKTIYNKLTANILNREKASGIRVSIPFISIPYSALNTE